MLKHSRVCRYTEYLAGVYKSKNKAAFERQKNEDGFKRKFDPFMFKEEVEQRSKTAQTTAVTVRATSERAADACAHVRRQHQINRCWLTPACAAWPVFCPASALFNYT